MIEQILIGITLTALLIASYTDLKTREVPDWLSYGLIFSALGIRTIYALNLDWNILLSGVIGLAACFLVACFFYYTKQWGGADSKLLMGMGAVIGISYPFTISSFQLLWYFFALLFLGAIYGLFWMLGIAVLKKDLFIPKFSETLGNYKTLHYSVWAVSLAVLGLSLKLDLLWSLTIIILGSFYLLLFTHSVERSCFYTRVPVEQLTEGDWLIEDVLVKGKRILSKKTLNKKDLVLLNRLYTERKVGKVMIKEGVPFVPSFLLAYITILVGNGLWQWLLQGIFI